MIRRIFTFLCLFALPISSSLAAQEPASPTTLPPGVQIAAEVAKGLNAKKLKVGDAVSLDATNNLRGPGDAIVIPKGAKLLGSVTDVADHSSGESRLSLLFNKAEWKGGSLPLHAIVTAIKAPKMGTQAPGEDAPRAAMGSGGSRGSAGTDSLSLIAQAIAQELKGEEIKETGDAKTGTAIVCKQHDVSLPPGTVVTLRQIRSE